MTIRKSLAVWTTAAALAATPATALAGGAAQGGDAPRAVAARTCSAGYTHAVISGAQKCLRRGQFCTHSADRQYRRYGYRCIRYYRNVNRYRLT